jgi:hypothetical protein
MEHAVKHQDEPLLLEMIWTAYLSPTLLGNLIGELEQLSLYNDWARRQLTGPQLPHCWFIAFKFTQPRELLAAFEFDYLVRNTVSRRQRGDLLGLMESAYDEALSLRYSGLYGIVQWADRGMNGAALFKTMRPSDSAETLLSAPSDMKLSFDDALLNPPYSRALEWTYFHVKMRRMAFLLLQLMAVELDERHRDDDFQTRGEAIDHILAVARHWRTLMWRDEYGNIVPLEAMQTQSKFSEERVVQFFSLPTEGADTNQWARLVSVMWGRMQRELPHDDAQLFLETRFYSDLAADRACVVDADLYQFIYDSSSSSDAFRARVFGKK